MEIRIRETGKVITEQEFRSLYPNTSFPSILSAELLDSFGVDAVLEGPQAQPSDQYQISVRDGVEEIDGKWFTKYALGPVFIEYKDETGKKITVAKQKAAYKAEKDALHAASVRSSRDQKLKDTDWTQGKDIVDNISTPWAAYRQSLRDIPSQTEFPWNVVWPEVPVL